MRVSELAGARLAYWVAKAEKLDTPNLINLTSKNEDDRECEYLEVDPENGSKNWALYEPHCNWAQGGPLIHKFGVSIVCESLGVEYSASIYDMEDDYWKGPTELIAVCRAIVAGKFGETVEDIAA